MKAARVRHLTRISDVTSVAVPVVDQEKAVRFYVDTLGFDVRLDVAVRDGGRWVQVAPPGAAVSVALVAGARVGSDTGITLSSRDAGADHEALASAGVHVDELLRWPGVPPMFTFRDVDGNQLKIMQVADETVRDPA